MEGVWDAQAFHFRHGLVVCITVLHVNVVNVNKYVFECTVCVCVLMLHFHPQQIWCRPVFDNYNHITVRYYIRL